MQLEFDTSFLDSIQKELEDLKKEISISISEFPSRIADIAMEQILNRDNWNDKARYQFGPMEGSKYDGSFSGNLLNTIKSNVYRVQDGTRFTVGIGNISQLDALRTESEASSSQRSKTFPYWRSFVYGRKGVRGYRFVWDGEEFYPFGRLKPKGYIVPGGSMEGTEGTYMFHNGLSASVDRINKLVLNGLTGASGRVKRRWR